MTIQTKLQQLREQWKQNPESRSTIELQVKVLQLGKKYPKFTSVEKPFINDVKKALI